MPSLLGDHVRKTLQIIALSVAVSTTLVSASTSVIYGEDGRQEVHEASKFNQELAKSTAIMISSARITPHLQKEGHSRLDQQTLKQWMDSLSGPPEVSALLSMKAATFDPILTFCDGEKFVEQPNPGMCSGFLIAPDLLVTAGHCVKLDSFCESYKWVFDFQVDKETKQAGDVVDNKNIYGCKKVVSSALIEFLGLDYGVVQLDRLVEGREPLKIRNNKKVDNKAELVVIGSPSGLPLKVTVGGLVRKNESSAFFSATLDTYQGNSGSAVFNAKTGVVEGILVRGENDFVPSSDNSCIESNKCAEDECRGEDVSRLTSVPEIALQNLLAKASATGDIPLLEKILKNKLWVDFYGRDRISALMKAAGSAQAEAIEILLSKGADANLVDLKGNTPLHYLAPVLKSSNARALENLILGKADLNGRNKAGKSPSLVAAFSQNLQGIKILFESGADKNATDNDGETVIFSFARQSNFNAALELVQLGVDISLPNKLTQTALEIKDIKGDTLLLQAAKKSDIESVLKLSKLGADINARDFKGETAIFSVIRSGSVESLQIMIASGAKLNVKSKSRVTPMKLIKKNNKEVLKKIREAIGRAHV